MYNIQVLRFVVEVAMDWTVQIPVWLGTFDDLLKKWKLISDNISEKWPFDSYYAPLVPRSRLLVKVKYQGHIFQEMVWSIRLVSKTHLVFRIEIIITLFSISGFI